MAVKFLQANTNRSRSSLDLLMHHAKEMGVGILMISELGTLYQAQITGS